MVLEISFEISDKADVEWKAFWFQRLSRDYWSQRENTKKFLDYISEMYGVNNPSDWQRITNSTITLQGGKVNCGHLCLISTVTSVYISEFTTQSSCVHISI